MPAAAPLTELRHQTVSSLGFEAAGRYEECVPK
jgi:hypothetical protein